MVRPFACDGVIIQDNKVVLIRRGVEPFKGQWALPGGRIEDNESAEQCLIREMREETNLAVEPIKLVGVYSDPSRDPRGVIVATYLCKVISGELKAGDDAGDAQWFDLDKLPELAGDHRRMVEDTIVLLKTHV